MLAGSMAASSCAGVGARIRNPSGVAAIRLHDWSALDRLQIGTRVEVDLDGSRFVDATLVSTHVDGLELATRTGVETLARASVVRVVLVKSAGQSAQFGAGIGLLVGALGWAGCLVGSGYQCGQQLYILAPAMVGGSAAVGALVHQRELIYERRQP